MPTSEEENKFKNLEENIIENKILVFHVVTPNFLELYNLMRTLSAAAALFNVNNSLLDVWTNVDENL